MCPILHRLTGILCSLGDENSLSHFSFLFVPFSFMIVNYGCEYRSSPHGQGSMDGLHPRLHNLIGLAASEMEFSTFSFSSFSFFPPSTLPTSGISGLQTRCNGYSQWWRRDGGVRACRRDGTTGYPWRAVRFFSGTKAKSYGRLLQSISPAPRPCCGSSGFLPDVMRDLAALLPLNRGTSFFGGKRVT